MAKKAQSLFLWIFFWSALVSVFSLDAKITEPFSAPITDAKECLQGNAQDVAACRVAAEVNAKVKIPDEVEEVKDGLSKKARSVLSRL
jgi:hypothetical protein